VVNKLDEKVPDHVPSFSETLVRVYYH